MRMSDLQIDEDAEINGVAELEPEEKLVANVIYQAFRDVHVRLVTHDSPKQIEQKLAWAADAHNFLTVRLWEEGNMYGEVLRRWGITSCNPHQVWAGAHVMREHKQGGRNDYD